MDDVVAQITNSSVSVDEFQKVIKSYAPFPYDEKALGDVKQCYLDQSEETLANYRVMMVIIHFPFFVFYNYIYFNDVHTHIYIHICTYLCILYIYIGIYLYIYTYLYTHMHIFPLMKRTVFNVVTNKVQTNIVCVLFLNNLI